jgi:hypothetical protein
MFLLGAAKNLGAKPLSDSVDSVLDVIRTIIGRECLVPDSTGIAPSNPRASCHGALVAAGRAVRGCFDQLDLDARRAVASLSRELMASKGADGGVGDSSHMPELDMIFMQAALQAGPRITRRHKLHATETSRHSAHRRPSEPALTMVSRLPAIRRLSLPGTMSMIT